MATQTPGINIGSQLAGADLRTAQFKFVKLNGSGQVVIASAAGEKVLGVLQNKPNTGEVADVMLIGVTKLISGAAVTAGALVMTDANAKAITAATTGSTIAGWALETAGSGAADVITVVLAPAVGVV
jgi:hypothetical protein